MIDKSYKNLDLHFFSGGPFSKKPTNPLDKVVHDGSARQMMQVLPDSKKGSHSFE
mgnify:CR=1